MSDQVWKDTIIAFGDTERLRITKEDGLLWIVREKLTEVEWLKVMGIPVNDAQVGDLCASLAREYDRSIEGKMGKPKTWYDEKLKPHSKG